MDRAYIDANHLVDRYVQGKLGGTELEEFEIYMLEHPGIVDDIEFANGMQESMNSASEDLFPSASSDEKASAFGTPYAMAATVLLAVSLTFSGYQYFQIQELRSLETDSNGMTVVGREYYLEPVRGESDTTIEQQADAATIIRADVGVVEAESWTVELHNERSDVVWSEEGLKADGHLVSIVLGEVPAGEYTLRILAEPSGALSAAYALEILPEKK